MALGSVLSGYMQLFMLIFAIYFSVTTIAVYFYMFWTGRLIKLQRALFLVAVFTALSVLTTVFFNTRVHQSVGFDSVFSLPLVFTIQHAIAVIFWLIVLIISVLFGSKNSF